MISIANYHDRTKHSLQRYARGPETLDWDDQPNPFRRFDGCEHVLLPKPGAEVGLSWKELLAVDCLSPAAVTIESLGLLLELTFGLAAWKQYGPDRWALRCNPSSGNLHPTEAYVVCTHADLLAAGVYHYISHDHLLEQRGLFQEFEQSGEVLIGLSSVHWREAWKYGERAFRYCQLDAGHALAALNYAASLLGWRIELLQQYTDGEIARLLGIDRTDEFVEKERESPDWICRICYRKDMDAHDHPALVAATNNMNWIGTAQSLGAYHMYDWPVIEEVAANALKLQHGDTGCSLSEQPTDALIASECTVPATKIIRQRRSAQHFNANSPAITQRQFFRILSALLAFNEPAFTSWPWSPAVHLCLFVHKVEGLPAGLYCLPRSEYGLQSLQESLNLGFGWEQVQSYGRLYKLYDGDMRRYAKTLSCHQAIASDGAFSLAMLAEFDRHIDATPWQYRRLFWECGVLGQVLYLEAETIGLRGTGIGCFFDDEVHEVLGLQDKSFQSLYHFTVGSSLEDSRIQTLPAYAHLDR
jgi:SagB-type dehydrogenase family enzyme